MTKTPSHNILCYGAGGMGKSTRLAETAAHFWKTQGKKTRVIGADGGGTTSALQILMDKGIVAYWPIDQWEEKSIFYYLDMATKGWWPEDPGTPNSPLLPGIREWKECPSCNGESGAKGLTMVQKCQACGVQFPAGAVLPIRREPANGLEEVACIGFEGLTSFGDLLLRRLRKVDPSGGHFLQDGEFKITAPGQQHYGSAQAYISQFVANVRQVPVECIFWTALELKADEDGKPLYGPALPGKKLTATCIPWFTAVLHLDGIPKKSPDGKVVKDANGMEVLDRKLYLAPHFPADAPGYKFAAKVSMPFGGEGTMPVVIEPNMKAFFEEYEKSIEKAEKHLLG